MQRVLVLDKNKQPLMPCHPARAKMLLKRGKAAVFRKFPFTIILKERDGGTKQPVQVKIDPGSKTTGIAIVADFKRGKRVILAVELIHRGQQIRNALLRRKQLRRFRRHRKTRYRQSRFSNRRRKAGLLPPSLQSRVNNILTWLKRLNRFTPVTYLALELVRFDTQKLQTPEISSIEYQQGTLQGYEVREYLLEKWERKCAYCGIENVPLQIEHIDSKVKGGSNRISNLAIACQPCNLKKGTMSAAEFGYPEIQAQAKLPLKDATAMNVTRYALLEQLKLIGLPLETGTGGQTKFNRIKQGYPKTHWLDAACVGATGTQVFARPDMHILYIKATGRQSRQMCLADKYGFPRTSAKQHRVIQGFQTGDIVKAIVTEGKKAGTYIGRVAVRTSQYFNIKIAQGTIQNISWKYLQPKHKNDGYEYLFVALQANSRISAFLYSMPERRDV